MQQAGEIWFPDSERHFLETKAGRPFYVEYQHDRLKAAYRHVDDWGMAIDVGAHVGLLTIPLAKRFKRVVAFEPNPESFACLVRNTAHLPNVECRNEAVGARCGEVGIDTSERANTGNRQVLVAGEGTPLVALDSFGFRNVGLIKIDVQGYEHQVLKGARRILRSSFPVCIVEQEPSERLDVKLPGQGRALDYIGKLGGRVKATFNADNIVVFTRRARRPFNKYEAKGDYHWRQYESDAAYREMVDVVVARIREDAPGRILDIGCGDGLYTHKLGAFGIDNDPMAVELAKLRDIECEQLDADSIGTLAREFDAVTMFDVFEHLPNQERTLARIAAIAPVLYILNPDPTQSRWHTREFTHEQLLKFLKRNGWACEWSFRIGAGATETKTCAKFRRD